MRHFVVGFAKQLFGEVFAIGFLVVVGVVTTIPEAIPWAAAIAALIWISDKVWDLPRHGDDFRTRIILRMLVLVPIFFVVLVLRLEIAPSIEARAWETGWFTSSGCSALAIHIHSAEEIVAFFEYVEERDDPSKIWIRNVEQDARDWYQSASTELGYYNQEWEDLLEATVVPMIERPKTPPTQTLVKKWIEVLWGIAKTNECYFATKSS